MTERILVLNSHEAWVAQLDGLPLELDIAVGLGGRTTRGWDERMRPVPRGARLVELPRILENPPKYDVVVAHSITDLLEVKDVDAPKLFVIHTTLEGRLAEESAPLDAREVAEEARRYLELTRTFVMSVSELKRRSWNVDADVLGFGVRVDDYPRATAELPRGIRVSNHFNRRRKILLADLHERAFSGLPIEFVGHNEDMPGVTAALDWSDLKERLARSRFFVHTADPTLEDGYNMATVEAMAAGLPILGNRHPTSPVEHGKSGFLSDSPEELRAFAERLLADRALALELGSAARARAAELFSLEAFQKGFLRILARTKANARGMLIKPRKKRR